MRTNSLFLAVVVTVLLSGCASMPPGDRGRPQRELVCNPGGRCTVTVVDPICAAGKCSAWVDFEPVRLAANHTNVMIRWDLPPGGAFGFCPTLGDGIFLKAYDSDDQFDQGGAIGPPGGPGGANTKCKQSYQLRGRHTFRNPVAYEYEVIFHDSAGHRYVIDPYIYND
jgi:hypothetical protein